MNGSEATQLMLVGPMIVTTSQISFILETTFLIVVKYTSSNSHVIAYLLRRFQLQHTCYTFSSIVLKTSISLFRCIWLRMKLNSAGSGSPGADFKTSGVIHAVGDDIWSLFHNHYPLWGQKNTNDWNSGGKWYPPSIRMTLKALLQWCVQQ